MTLDDTLINICDKKIAAKLISSWPVIDDLGAENMEVNILRREANKKRKLLPLKQLFNQISSLLTKIKPVFMMSPLSVSSFLDPEKYHFDTVIFDEASQMKTESAAVALYRADSVIVVGDTEQLPPTSFFDSIDLSTDEFANPFESVLSEATTVMPHVMLKWHYRSIDERLIAFSNQEIYKNLITIPNTTYSDDNYGVSYTYVADGIYSPGLRTNKKEAEKVVDLIFKHAEEKCDKSLGVVTLNTAQQELINNLILKRRYADKKAEDFFTKKDNFFVKNLETVQGDERDVIILSIGFAKTLQGKFSMNFGPINREGGYRRLNVAITRAKEKVLLVGSVLPEDFKLTNKSSRGSRMLLDYLKYAIEKGETSFEEKLKEGDYILNDIVFELKKLGYEASINVGLSDFKVDIAVKKGDKFTLAILLDSNNFDKFDSLRSKEKIRQNLLNIRGWKIYNTLSLAYIINKELELKNITELLEDDVESFNIENNVAEDEFFVSKRVNTNKTKDLFMVYPDEEALIKNISEEYFDPHLRIMHIIEALSPISQERLFKLLLPLYYKTRLTEKQRGILSKELSIVQERMQIYKTSGFILTEKDLINITFRRAKEGIKNQRSITEIYEEELSAGILKILSYATKMKKEALYIELNKLLDFKKSTKEVTDIYDSAVNYLIARKEIKEENKILFLV